MSDKENIGSQKVAEKMGMRLEKKTELPVNGVNEPVWIYSTSKSQTPSG
ncbi:MAG: GNAT family N-acetyltransferase [Anaerolineales bacterium]|nr:GNAT family N-acetyltransferase [Anaerolineales bacterium]MCB9146532.1 GNAT family N-acetyltransferase [Anaerolineales bacterium]